MLNDLEGLILCANSIGLSDGEFEHIIVDGQSLDGSFEYAQELSNRPYTRVIKQTSKYIYGAFNDGLSASNGKYIIYLHCGDELNINVVMNLVKDLNGCDLIAASCSQKSGDQVFHYYRSGRKKISPASMSILQPSLIIRRDKYNEVGGFDSSYKISADVDCVLKILKVSDNVCYVDDLVVHMEEFGLSKAHYFQKLREHTLIKFRHGPFYKALFHIPQKLFLDFILVPLWVFIRKRFKKTLRG